MKKLLGVSIVAMLAVAPGMADAAVGKMNAPDAVSNTNIATTSYVKGAYKVTADKIDAVIDDITTTDGTYSKAANSVGVNLKTLDSQIKANTDAISALNGAGGSIATQIKEGAEGADFTATNASGITSDKIGEAINEVGEGLEGVKDDLATLSGNVNDALDLKQNKSDSTVTSDALTNAGLVAGTDLNANEGVAANLIKVAAKAKANTTAINTINNSAVMASGIDSTKVAQIATNTENIGTINNKVINVVSDWATNAVVVTKISDLPNL